MKIIVLDKTLANLRAQKAIFDYPVEKIWNPSGVSLTNRIKNDKKLVAKIKKVLVPDNLRKYVVDADMASPTRCVDGRPIKGWKKSSEKPLGPKVAGGTAHAALAHRIVDVQSLRNDLIFEHDIEFVIKRYTQIGIGFGGHIDDHAHGFNTGCGAVDNIDLILKKLRRPEPQEHLRGLAKLIMGDAYEGAHVTNEVIGRMLFLNALKPTYLPKVNNDPKGEYLYKKTIVRTIRKASTATREPVPALTGAHNEVAVILNFVKGKTFDNHKFNSYN